MEGVKKRRNCGFALIEIIVALGVFSLAVVVFGTVIHEAVHQMREENNWSMALDFARSQIEYLHTTSPISATSQGSVPFDPEGKMKSRGFSATIELSDSGLSSELKKANISVGWEGHFGKRDIRLFTFVRVKGEKR